MSLIKTAIEKPAKITFKIQSYIHETLANIAKKESIDISGVVQKIVEEYVIGEKLISKDMKDALELYNKIIFLAKAKSRDIFDRGLFDEHFTLTVFQELMKDVYFREIYEKAIGGDAYDKKLEGKNPLNMYLGWYIKNTISAEPVLDEKGKPKRIFVSNEPIQSYTALKLA